MTRRLPSPAEGSTANVMGALALALTDRMSEAVAASAGQSLSGAAAVSALEHILDAPTIERLSQVLGLSHSGAVRLVDRMEVDGHVRRERGPDGRSTAVSLTPSGRAAAALVTSARAGVLEAALAPLGPAERDALGDLVGRMLVGMIREPGATRWTCRLCDTAACGRYTGGCPIGRAVSVSGATGTRPGGRGVSRRAGLRQGPHGRRGADGYETFEHKEDECVKVVLSPA